MSRNAQIYEHDCSAWCLTTAALIRAGKWHDAGWPGGGRGSRMGHRHKGRQSPIRAQGPVNAWGGAALVRAREEASTGRRSRYHTDQPLERRCPCVPNTLNSSAGGGS